MQHINKDLGISTKYMVILSKATGAMRRIVASGNDDNYKFHLETMHPGEIEIYVDHAEWESFKNVDHMKHEVAKKIGFDGCPHPSTTRHAHVNEQGVVVNIIEADLTCGDHGSHLGHKHTLIQHPTAEIGHKIKVN